MDAGGVFIAEFRTTFRHADIQLQEYGGYISDITRTWPISGAFTQPQKDLYDAVLSTQRHCISLCRANASVSLDDLHSIAETDLKDNLSQIGFDMSGKVRILHIGQLVNVCMIGIMLLILPLLIVAFLFRLSTPFFLIT